MTRGACTLLSQSSLTLLQEFLKIIFHKLEQHVPELVVAQIQGVGVLRRAKRGAFLTKYESSERAKIVE